MSQFLIIFEKENIFVLIVEVIVLLNSVFGIVQLHPDMNWI